MNEHDVDHFFPGAHYSGAVHSLMGAFVNNKGMPLVLSNKNTYFAGTTATALLALHRIGALDQNKRLEFQHTLMRLRPSGTAAWDAREGLSVWNTSNAIWALASTGYDKQALKDSVKWVIQQYNQAPGFGPKSSDPNLFISAYAAQALHVAADPASVKGILDDLANWVCRSALPNGAWPAAYRYNTNGEPDPTATLCALWILQGDVYRKEHQQDNDVRAKYQRLIDDGLAYLRSALTGSPGIWPMAGVPAVYVHKDKDSSLATMSVYSFTPSFVIPLLRMKLAPYDPLILEPIRWLHDHVMRDQSGAVGWDSAEHDHISVKSHATAFALWAIHNWTRAVAHSAREDVARKGSATLFIVHGRNKEKLDQLKSALTVMKAPHPQVLVEETHSLGSIFTRVTEAARRCDYALILATPDDLVYPADNPNKATGRARQNVMLELGLFLGLIGERRMALLISGAVEIPSDLGGVNRIHLEDSDWTKKLQDTLQAAGMLRESM